MPEISAKPEKLKQDLESKAVDSSGLKEEVAISPLANATGEPTSVIESIGRITTVIADQAISTIPSTSGIVIDTNTSSPPVITSLSRSINSTFGIVTTTTATRGRKRTAMSRLPAKLKEPAAVARRNARERRRVKMVNDGFMRLRKHVPTDPKNKKLSKVKTLRLAIDYIKHLQQMLMDSSASSSCKPSQILTGYSQMTGIGDELDASGSSWLNPESMFFAKSKFGVMEDVAMMPKARAHRDLDDDIFQTINPARLRTAF